MPNIERRIKHLIIQTVLSYVEAKVKEEVNRIITQVLRDADFDFDLPDIPFDFDTIDSKRIEALKTLGLHSGASKDDIKSAFRTAVKTYHPDLNKSSHATLKYRQAVEAYETLVSR